MPIELKVLKLPDGSVLHFEEDLASPESTYLAALPSPNMQADFKATLNSVKMAAGEMFEAMASLAHPPDSCELTLGLKLSAEAGFIVARAQGEANFGIKLTWKSESVKK